MAKLQEEIEVRRAMEKKLNKTVHVTGLVNHFTEETTRGLSDEIKSRVSGIVDMADRLSTTNLDRQQRELLNVMISSGKLVLQFSDDILDRSKVESGVTRLGVTKFRPREMVRNVLQIAAASLRKMLTLEGHISDDVPFEVIGDVLSIRQILAILISNGIKYTNEGKVGIRLSVVLAPCSEEVDSSILWIRCDVYDTGIRISEHALPTLLRKYTQTNADRALNYGGTGPGLAICKRLVELMGGHLTVSTVDQCGSTFTFELPYRVSLVSDNISDDPDEIPAAAGQANRAEADDMTAGCFLFQPGNINFFFA